MAELQLFQPGKTFYDSFQQGRGNTLAKLAITGDQTQRKGALADLYGLNPEMAQAAQSQIKANDEQDYADLIDSAKVMYSLKGRPEADMMWQRVAPKFSQKYGVQFNPTPQPSDWDAIEKIVQAAGTGGQDKYAGAPFVVMENNKPVYYRYGPNGVEATGLSAPDQYQLIEGRDGYYRVPTKRPGDASAVDVGQGDGASTPTPAPTAAPVGSGGVVFQDDVQGAAQRTQNIMTQVRQEIAALVAQGVPVDQATSQVTQKYAKARGLNMPSGGQSAPPVSQPVPPPVATGGKVRLEGKPDDPKDPTWNTPVVEVRGGKRVRVRYNNQGGEQVLGEAEAEPKSADFGDINTLRDDYSKAVAKPIAMMDAYEKMRQAYKNPTPAGDIALVYAYMKILDPTSVVREAEFETAVKAGSVPDTIKNLFYKAKSGELLTENRQDFLEQGAKLYVGAKQQYNQVRQQFGGIVQRNGMNPADVLVDTHVPISKKFPPKQQGGKYSVGQVLNINGKRYQVTGGDLNSDPDLKELP